MKKILIGVFLTLLVSFYIFPFSFTFLPGGVNTKMIIAGFGVIAFIFDSIRSRSAQISRNVFVSAILAILFSGWCFYSVTINATERHVYDTYVVSFFTWLTGAYGCYFMIRLCHGKANIDLLSRYLALTCVFQCVLTLLIDNVPFVHDFVNAFAVIENEFFERGGRLYGLGFALDPAGVRMSAILVVIAYQIMRESHRGNHLAVTLYFLSVLIITVVGSMVSRTTIVGSSLAIAYILVTNGTVSRGGYVYSRQVGLFAILTILVCVGVVVSVYLYNASAVFHEDLRFAFEGFFNWAETGTWSTGSTDKLATMWVWPDPEDTRTWWIGSGHVGVFQTNSDIGYCNFIFYCGLIGLALYSLYFIYNHLSLIAKFDKFILTSILLCAVTFIVWSKVQTDIFFIDALLFCIAGDFEKDSAETV